MERLGHMCISSRLASFTGTRIAVIAQEDGSHLMLYDCIAASLSNPHLTSVRPPTDGGARGPAQIVSAMPPALGSPKRNELANCMILLIARRIGTTPKVLDTTSCPKILDDMEAACQIRTRAAFGAVSKSASPHSFQVTSSGIFHVVTADTPEGILAGIASEQVPDSKRAIVNPELLNNLRERAPGYAFAVACFNNADAKRATPIAIQYTPAYPGAFIFPGLDAHDGGAPKDGNVDVNHWLFAGAMRSKVYGVNEVEGEPVNYSRTGDLDGMLPHKVCGMQYPEGLQLENGDFTIPIADALRGNWEKMRRQVSDIQAAV